MDAPPATPGQAQGRWSPSTAISYGVAISTFQPVLSPQPAAASSPGHTASLGGSGTARAEATPGEELNPHQVPLEVGDEVYVFEVFRSLRTPLASAALDQPVVWYRGYVVSTSPQPKLPALSDLYAFPAVGAGVQLSEEPQVSVGIFPSTHVQIRDHLDDAENRLSLLVPTLPPQVRVPGGQLAPLREEEEDVDLSPIPISPSRPNGDLSPQKKLNRLSGSTLSGFGGGGGAGPRPSLPTSRPSPPLPNLKCGDETISGATEPLIDEIACALREWASLLYTHLYNRNYSLFQSVTAHINVLHAGRRQLLARTLGADEECKLRRECVALLVRGNVEQDLDVVVRHPTWGGLVEVDVDSETTGEVGKGWCSAVRMYAMQVALAYFDANLTIPDLNLSFPLVQRPETPVSASNAHLSLPNTLRKPSLLPSAPSSHPASDAPPLPNGAKFYHIFVEVRAFVANPCMPGETAELYFSLFNRAEARYLTEEFCMILNHNGAPDRESEGRFDKLKTLFRDLSAHDLGEEVFLVCRIVKNGGMKLGDMARISGGGLVASLSSSNNHSSRLGVPRDRSDASSFDSSVSQTGVDFGLGTLGGMLSADKSGRRSYRRPFGCAVLEVSQFNKPALGGERNDAEHHMPIFVPVNEASFANLHEDIIASRVKEIEKSPRAEHLVVNVRIVYGEAPILIKELPSLLSDVVLTQRLGFPDVTFPGDGRNEVYVKLWSGDFTSAGGTLPKGRGLAPLGGGRNIEVTVEVRTKDGALVDRALSRGAGEPNVTQYSSMVFRSNNTPIWGELVKLDVPVELIEQCHVFFTFRARSSSSKSGTISSGLESPFAFAYLPLFLDSTAFVSDGSHTLILYRYERHCAHPQFYFQAPSVHPPGVGPVLLPTLPLSLAKTLVPLRDTVVVRSFLVSTRYTQNETLLQLLRWETKVPHNVDDIKDILIKLRFCSEVEVCKFLRDIFDALFGILISDQNQSGELDSLLFQALVTILAIVSDRRFTNFKPVLDVYIERHFTCSTASSHIIKLLDGLLRNRTSAEAGTVLRSSIKVWHYLFKFIVRSREIQRSKDVGMGVTSDHLESTFKRELSGLISQINSLMRATSPSSVIGTQTLVVQHFASIIPDLAKCFSEQELADIVISFGDSVVASKGKMLVWKLLLQNQIVHSAAFGTPAGRAALVPNIVRWIKPSLGRFDEVMLFSPKDSQPTRDNARVSWIEGIRLAVGVVAAMLDSIQEALATPNIRDSRSLLGQEQDNVEYMLGLLPRLLESYRELENPANLESVQRHRSQASVVSVVPVVFPSSYPFSLLAKPPPQGRLTDAANPTEPRPTLRAGMGEIACIFVSLLLLAPRKIFVNWLEGTLEVEGKDNFARLLTQIFRVSKSILGNNAYPAKWLNINILAHRMVVRMVDPIAEILERDFIPSQQASFTFNTALWRDFFEMLLKLLASPQLLIEEFSPQKRRVVWRLAGDIRGDGAKIFSRLWSAIGWPDHTAGALSPRKDRHGGYQVQFVPGLVEDVISLCLSHHDELRTSAVHVLHSMIVSEYYLDGDFSVIQGEVIDRLDKLFMSQSKSDEISRAFFVGQLRTLFEESAIDDRLREQMDAFLTSVNSFLDLLLAVRNLPEGEEYQEDRIISTLKLMSFIRGIGRSEIYVRYVQRLVTYHVALGNETEAGLTLKLHADLHKWDLHCFLDPIPDLDLPRQTEFARKETLYMRMLGHHSKGKSWELALDLCKELQHQYETTSFNYSRLAELLVLQSELYSCVAKSERSFGEYFRVAFYGTRFPSSVCGKQFIYRGHESEKLSSFVEKMLNKHPGAQLLKTSTIPPDELQFADGQFLQITAVTPEPELDALIFRNPDVPPAIRRYHQYNGVKSFSFSRPLNKDPGGRAGDAYDYTALWTEKTWLKCEDAFPTILRRSEVVEIRIVETSPLENALNDVEAKRKELDNLEHRYHFLSETETDRSQISTTLLSMALNNVVDAPVNQGVPMYRRAFFSSDFMAANPDKAGIIQKLHDVIDSLAQTISRCMKLHAALAPEPMQPFHQTLEKFFEKNFADELARLPQDLYQAPFAPSPADSFETPAISENGSISISGIPRSSSDLGYSGRDSVSTVRSSGPASPSSASSGRRESSTSIFHIPPLANLSGASTARNPLFYVAGGRSLDAVAETGPPTGSPVKSWKNGSVSSSAMTLSTNVSRPGSISSEQTSTASERRGSVLGSIRWKRKAPSASFTFVSKE